MNVLYRAVDCFSPVTPSVAKALKAAGYSAVFRYLGAKTHGWTKGLTPTERDILHNAGLGIIPIWEGMSTNRKYFTAEQGKRDAHDAAEELRWLNAPTGLDVYFAVDFDAQPADFPAVRTYFNAIAMQRPPYNVGLYGGINTVNNVTAKRYWQTAAWSYGKVSPRAAALQNAFEKTIAGANFDLNEVYAPIGVWWPSSASKEVMPTLTIGSKGEAVKELQEKLNAVLKTKIAVDGIFGKQTLGAVKSFQKLHRLTVDGIVGNLTWEALNAAVAAKKTA